MDVSTSKLAERLHAVEARITEAAERSGRTRDEITLGAISKTRPADVIADALAAGVTDVGENRAQELKQKVAVLGDGPRWHFVGHLQTNKVRNVVGSAVLIHSVDR